MPIPDCSPLTHTERNLVYIEQAVKTDGGFAGFIASGNGKKRRLVAKLRSVVAMLRLTKLGVQMARAAAQTERRVQEAVKEATALREAGDDEGAAAATERAEQERKKMEHQALEMSQKNQSHLMEMAW